MIYLGTLKILWVIDRMNKITEKQGKSAFHAHELILTLKRKMGMAFITMGRLLKIIRDNEYYKVLSYDSFASYVENSELGFKRRTAYYYIEIYEWFVCKLQYKNEKLAEIGYDKLIKLLPIIKRADRLSPTKRKERVELLVDDVQQLRPVDFGKKYKDEKKSEDFEDYLEPPEYFRCKDCGKWILIVPVEDCCENFLKNMQKKINKKLSIDNEETRG